ncbi:E3 ubiquitin-protein ligase goliath isoform X1 [Onthophagus taurus]|uniref:E3 ubiquitin-protein ligase goliath isoform X1 n=1 Tax=Onthophagus taurus TaxID=166361 RepID=UPI000C2001B9|nr:protein goliath isoform X1 [Onthophagus taurus]
MLCLFKISFILISSFSYALSTINDDWASSSQSSSSESVGASGGTFTKAYINITQKVYDGKWIWERDEYGRFGSGYVGPAKGILIHVAGKDRPQDHTGCTIPLLNSGHENGSLPSGADEPWVALVKRGRCNFQIKVDNAFKSGAVGIIVYNDRESTNLDQMKLPNDSGKNISAIFTFKWKGEQMASYLENNSQVYVHITVGSTQPLRNGAINRTSVLFVSTTFIVLMIISLAWLIFYYVQRFRHIHAKDKLSKRLSSAAKKALSKIPTKTIKCEDKEVKEGECCAVCIEPYKSCEILRILPCSHEFHKGCIDPWLLEHRTCPMCKMDILKRYGFVFSGSQESILQIDPDDIASLDAPEESVRHGSTTNGVSPLPQIRAEIQFSYDSSNDENCSRASTPNELTPSLGQSGPKYTPVPSQFCLNCRGATTTNVLVNNKDIEIDMEEGSSNITKEIIKENVDNQ